MAGVVTEDSRVRELGVYLRNVRPGHIEWGELIINKTSGDDAGFVGKIRVKDHVDQKTRNSARVFTNIKVEETNWDWKTQPTDDIMYCCELRVNGHSEAFGCLQLRPRWMEEMLPELGELRMRALAIPGTHQSGSIRRARFWESWALYSDCQEETVYTQLLYGIRFLDLRPGAVESAHPDSGYRNKTYLIVHWNYYQSVSSILWDVKLFLDRYTKEVVIIDFHEFPEGFNTWSAFRGLERLVYSVLGRHIFLKGRVSPAEMTVAEVLRRGRRAIVTFEQNDYLREIFLPEVNHIWANTDKLDRLQEYLRWNSKSWRGDRFLSAMAQTTARNKALMFIDWYRGGVRGIAHKNNLAISDWYALDEEMREDANIIAMDYFASSDIVEICISINRERIRDPERANTHYMKYSGG